MGKVAAGRKLVDEAGEAMEDIVTSVQLVADIIGGVATASQEQSSGIEQINQAVGQMDEITQQNAALVEEAAAAAESLQSQSARLAELVSTFRLNRGPHRPMAPAMQHEASPAYAAAGESHRLAAGQGAARGRRRRRRIQCTRTSSASTAARPATSRLTMSVSAASRTAQAL